MIKAVLDRVKIWLGICKSPVLDSNDLLKVNYIKFVYLIWFIFLDLPQFAFSLQENKAFYLEQIICLSVGISWNKEWNHDVINLNDVMIAI